MARKTKIEIAAQNVEATALAFKNARAELDRAASLYADAYNEWKRLEAEAAARAKREPRHEYAVVLLDEHGDAMNTEFHDTLADAHRAAREALRTLVGDSGEVVGAVIERVRLSDLERTTVGAVGKVSPEWFDGDAAGCDGCDGTFPSSEVEVMGDSERGSFGFCRSCRAKDAKAAQG